MSDRASSGLGLTDQKGLEEHNVNEDHRDSVQDVVDLTQKQHHNQPASTSCRGNLLHGCFRSASKSHLPGTTLT